MSVVRLGSTQKFSDNWDSIFGGKKKAKTVKSAKPASAKRKAAANKKKVTKSKRGK